MFAPLLVDVVSTDPILDVGLRNWVSSGDGFRLVVVAGSAGAAGMARRADVVVVPSDTVDDETVQLVRAAREFGGGARVLLVPSVATPEGALRAIDAGVCGIVWRRKISRGELAEAVRAVAFGEGTLPVDLLGDVSAYLSQAPEEAPGSPWLNGLSLNERERRVLQMLADGFQTTEIAKSLAYSNRTVTVIIRGIIGRLRVRNRAHAVAYALKVGLI
jgi:DNA-binding NarL/FixJ family response regulator